MGKRNGKKDGFKEKKLMVFDDHTLATPGYCRELSPEERQEMKKIIAEIAEKAKKEFFIENDEEK